MDQPDEKDTKPKRRNPFWRLGRRLKRVQDKDDSEKDEAAEKDDEKAPAATSDAE